MDERRLRTPERALVAEDERHYWVTGFCKAQLLDCLRIAGPERQGVRYFAYTDWAIDYVWASGATGALLVQVKVITHLPRWLSAGSVPAPLHEEWRQLVEGLRDHEHGHRDIAVSAAGDLLVALRRLASLSAPREALRTEARALLEATLQDARRAESQYDSDTRHGSSDPRVGQWMCRGDEDREQPFYE